jgi:DNA-binding transcriptional MerR regulator
MKLKIGQFARMCQVPVKTLRYYDDVELLKPAHVDSWTGYRYYDPDQIKAVNRILALKELGLSLDQIRQIMREELPFEEMKGMLRLKRAELEQQNREIEEQLRRVDARMRQIEWEGQMPEYDVVLKRAEPVKGAMLRDTVSKEVATAGSYMHFDELTAYLRSHGLTKANITGPAVDILYDAPDGAQEDLGVAVFIPIDRDVPGTERIRMEELPVVEQMVCVVHHGPFDTIGAAHVAALEWIEQNGYSVNGPNRGLYLQYERGGDPNNFITEIQYPVTSLGLTPV